MGSVFVCLFVCFITPIPPVYARECQWETFCVVRLKPRERRTCIYAYCSPSRGLVRGFFVSFFFLLPCLKMFQRFTKYNIKTRHMTCFLKKKTKIKKKKNPTRSHCQEWCLEKKKKKKLLEKRHKSRV